MGHVTLSAFAPAPISDLGERRRMCCCQSCWLWDKSLREPTMTRTIRCPSRLFDALLVLARVFLGVALLGDGLGGAAHHGARPRRAVRFWFSTLTFIVT